jgi:hypothetical protein
MYICVDIIFMAYFFERASTASHELAPSGKGHDA